MNDTKLYIWNWKIGSNRGIGSLRVNHNKAESVAENIADYLDNSFSNPYDRTFYASKEGRYIIKAKVHDLVIGNIIDTIEFEQIVETGDETIIAMDLQQKILRALQLTDWKVELDFAALNVQWKTLQTHAHNGQSVDIEEAAMYMIDKNGKTEKIAVYDRIKQ